MKIKLSNEDFNKLVEQYKSEGKQYQLIGSVSDIEPYTLYMQYFVEDKIYVTTKQGTDWCEVFKK